MRTRKRWIALAAAAALAVSVCGCAEEEKPTFTGEKTEEAEYQDCLNAIAPSVYGKVEGLELEPGTYISIIGKSESAAYWKMVEQGVMQAAEDLNAELGYTGEDKIKVTYNAPEEEENIDEQVNILDEELARYPDVLGIASVDEEACIVQFDLATTNGIPIISLDSGNTYKGIYCTVKTDNQDAAKTSASKLADELEQDSSVILLVHDSASETAREREESFVKQMNEEEGKTVAEVIYCDQMDELKKQMLEELSGAQAEGEEESADNEDEAEADASEISERSVEDVSDEEVIQYYIEKHGATGVFGTNPDATQLGIKAIELCENAEQIVLMGFDAGADQLQALRDGKVSGLVVQNPFGIGYASVVAAARTVLEIGNEAIVDTGYVWVTMENIEDESIQALLYE